MNFEFFLALVVEILSTHLSSGRAQDNDSNASNSVTNDAVELFYGRIAAMEILRWLPKTLQAANLLQSSEVHIMKKAITVKQS